MYYTGIGSRETPDNILIMMNKLGKIYQEGGLILRSGGAPGADLAFEKLVNSGSKNIYLPWKGFNENSSQLFNITEAAYVLAEQHLPHWNYLKDPVKKLMARNVYQVLGYNLDNPSDFLVCWTQDGVTKSEEVSKKTGGTGMAIRVACAYSVPVFNLGKEEILQSFVEQYKL